MLHVVDLDGARQGSPAQLPLIWALVARVRDRVRVEVAGGLRTNVDVADALAAGAARAVVGTSAIHDAVFAAALVRAHGADRVVVALDVRDGKAVGEGWRMGAAGVDAAEALARLADAGIRTFEVTAIDRDGSLDGPDLALLANLVALRGVEVIASGGIRSLEDLRAVRDIGCAGAIVGRALYEGRLDLGSAVSEFGDEV